MKVVSRGKRVTQNGASGYEPARPDRRGGRNGSGGGGEDGSGGGGDGRRRWSSRRRAPQPRTYGFARSKGAREGGKEHETLRERAQAGCTRGVKERLARPVKMVALSSPAKRAARSPAATWSPLAHFAELVAR